MVYGCLSVPHFHKKRNPKPSGRADPCHCLDKGLNPSVYPRHRPQSRHPSDGGLRGIRLTGLSIENGRKSHKPLQPTKGE